MYTKGIKKEKEKKVSIWIRVIFFIWSKDTLATVNQHPPPHHTMKDEW